MRQPILASGNLTTTTGTRWVGLFGPDTLNLWTATEALATAPWLAAGTFRNLHIKCLVAPGGATAHVFALRVNGADSALTCTVSGVATTGSDIANDVVVAVGDSVSLQRDATGGSPATSIIFWSMEFESSVAGESAYTIWGVQSLSSLNTINYSGPFSPYQSTSDINGKNLVGAAGSITRYDVELTSAPGAGTAINIVLMIDGVVQDGGGGTTDTQLTISDLATTGSWTGSLALTSGKQIQYRLTRTGAAASTTWQIATKFVATIDGQSQVCAWDNANMSTSVANYSGCGVEVWQATEANGTGVMPGEFYFWGLQALIATAPGTAKSYTLSLRKNGAAASPTPTITRTGTVADVIMADTNPANVAVYAAGDSYSIESIPAGTPTAGDANITFISSDFNPAGVSIIPFINGGLLAGPTLRMIS